MSLSARPDDPRAPGSAPPCAGSRMTTAKVFCGGGVGSIAGCAGAGVVGWVAGVDACGAGWAGAAGVCADCGCAENACAAATIHTKNKQIDLLGTSTRIPESFQS